MATKTTNRTRQMAESHRMKWAVGKTDLRVSGSANVAQCVLAAKGAAEEMLSHSQLLPEFDDALRGFAEHSEEAGRLRTIREQFKAAEKDLADVRAEVEKLQTRIDSGDVDAIHEFQTANYSLKDAELRHQVLAKSLSTCYEAARTALAQRVEQARATVGADALDARREMLDQIGIAMAGPLTILCMSNARLQACQSYTPNFDKILGPEVHTARTEMRARSGTGVSMAAFAGA